MQGTSHFTLKHHNMHGTSHWTLEHARCTSHWRLKYEGLLAIGPCNMHGTSHWTLQHGVVLANGH